MFFFNSKKKLIDTGIFQNATDWHSHILPGVDDGISSMEQSIKTLNYYERIGISDVWLTPHIMEDIPNQTAALRKRFDELQTAYKGSVRLHLAAENMIDNLFNERLANRDLLPIGPKGDHLLVETSYFQPPLNLYDTLQHIREAGYQPILAHPERYAYMDDADYDRLACMRIKTQLNLGSLIGGYGPVAQEKAMALLSKGFYDFYGSDLHHLESFKYAINAKALKKQTIQQLAGIQNAVTDSDWV